MDNLYGKVFAKSTNGKKVLILNTNRNCLRIRQRSKDVDNVNYKRLKFVSYKEMLKLWNIDHKNVLNPVNFYNISKL
jgi:hypothetical protein